MLGEFWSELFKSVGGVLGGSQREFVFTDQGDLSPEAFAEQAASQTGTLAAPPMWVQAKTQIEALQKADPNFIESDFLVQASKTFGAALAAEGAMDASPITALVTPTFLQSFQQRIDHWRSGGFTRTVGDVKLDPPATLKVTVGGEQEAITVRFTGNAKRFTKEDMTNLLTEGSAQADSFTEFATFVRPAGSTTPQTTAVGAPSHCPSCGAPVDSGAMKCAFCGAPLTGTGGTWLLDKLSASAYT